MYAPILNKEALQSMRREAERLKEECLEFAEDMELYAKPEFWEAIEQVETGKSKKNYLETTSQGVGFVIAIYLRFFRSVS